MAQTQELHATKMGFPAPSAMPLDPIQVVQEWEQMEKSASVPAKIAATVKPPSTELELEELGDLLSRPAVPIDWLVEGRLVAGSVSMFVAKPKVGKSTAIRHLALCVARGESWLGYETKRGSVIYLALEERLEDVIEEFRALGATPDDAIRITHHGTVLQLVTTLRKHRPALLVIDPLFRLISVKDEKAYAEVYQHMGPLIDVARETGTHICCSHHSPKQAREDAIDAPLGSTALAGSVSSLFVMSRSPESGMRTLRSTQRVGDDMPEMVLRFNPQTRQLWLDGTRQHAEVNSLKPVILSALNNAEMAEQEILDAAEGGKTGAKRTALRELCRDGLIERSGTGKKGNPFLYRKSRALEATI